MKNWLKEGESKLEKLLEKIENHPLTRQIQADEAAETLTARKQAAGQIETLRKEQAETITRLQAVAAEKEQIYLQAKAAFEIAGAAWNRARGELRAENTELDRQIRIQSEVLIESADQALDEGIQFFRDQLDELRKPGRIESRGRSAERNIFTEKIKITSESNNGAVLDAINYCRAAIDRLEMLKLEPALDLKEIEAMKSGIPKLDVFSEFSGEKPMPGSKGVNPLQLAKSEDQQAWEIGKINEKFKKIMRRKTA